ncbi:MAG TPA: SIMPL domain-containing protein [Candidatus Methylomirabilis sp.]|nr:SIMPL domain-containing protein [Candidatus Methylomirabilis sp.]
MPNFALVFVRVLIISLPFGAFAQAPVPVSASGALAHVLRVTGDARIRVAPDVAVLFAGIESTDRDLARVTKEAADQMARLLAAIAEAGVSRSDIQTTRHDIRVERPWDNGKPGPITGYTVADEARVTVRDISKLGRIMERIAAAGSNSLRGLSFEKEDPTPERARSLALAYASARTKAEALARAAGARLGSVVSLNEAAQGPVVPMFRTAHLDALAPGAPVSAGEVEISGVVEVVFALD